MTGEGFSVRPEVAGSVLILRLHGELDISSAEGFRREVEQALVETNRRAVVLSCRHLSFLDSSGLGAILGRYRQLQGRGGRMAVAGVSGRVKTVLDMSGVSKLIPVYDSEKKAVQALGGEVAQCTG